MPIPRQHKLLAALFLFGAASASAQFTGPGAREPSSLPVARTVSEIRSNAAEDRPVELTGHILRQTGRETYVFADATGEISVEIDAEDFPAGRPVAADTRVHLTGEIDSRLMREPQVEVDELHLAAAAAAP